jgi:hypothetical protein
MRTNEDYTIGIVNTILRVLPIVTIAWLLIYRERFRVVQIPGCRDIQQP